MDESENIKLGEFIISLAKGNISVLDNIYVLVSRLLYVIANIYYSQKEDIEDVIQDFLEHLVVKSKKFKQNKNACAWLTITFKNFIKNCIKHQSLNGQKQDIEVNKDFSSCNKNSETYLYNHILLSEIFSELNESDKELILYRFFDKCTLREIANILHISKSSVEKKINKLKIKIEKKLQIEWTKSLI